jgi:hypothetical protein
LLSNIQFTLNSIFGLYKTQGKRWYGFSMMFAIFSTLSSVVIVSAFLYVYYQIDLMLDGAPEKSFGYLIKSGQFLTELQIYSQLIMILHISVYSIFLHNQRSSQEPITFGGFFRGIDGRTWGWYLVFALGGILVSKLYSVATVPQFPYTSNPLYALISEYQSPLMSWFLSVLQLVTELLPVLLAFLLIRMNLSAKNIRLTSKEAWTSFISLLIISLAITNFSYDILGIIQKYILVLLLIPFVDNWIPYLLVYVICLLLLAIFYLGLAGAMLFPFLYHGNKELANERFIDK